MLADRADWLQVDVDWTAPSASPTYLATLAARDLSGIRVATTQPSLADALVAAGGHVTRRGTQMVYDVRRAPPPDSWGDRGLRDGVLLVDYPPVDEQIAAAWLDAYPPEHPNRDDTIVTVADSIADLAPLRNGEATGPFSESSTVAVNAEGGVVGAVLVTLMPDNSMWSGPWIPDLFVVTALRGRGLGARLLRYAIAATEHSGADGIALTVSSGNPARLLYEKVGFEPGPSFTTVAMP